MASKTITVYGILLIKQSVNYIPTKQFVHFSSVFSELNFIIQRLDVWFSFLNSIQMYTHLIR